MDGLTGKQLAFVTAYLNNGGNATKAAVSAGYSAKSAGALGSRMLKDVKIKELIDVKAQENALKSDITRQSQLDRLQELYTKALRAQQFGPAIKAIEVINKMLGFEVPKEQANQQNIFLALPLETRLKVFNELKKVG
jgi:phage terminase small subunit